MDEDLRRQLVAIDDELGRVPLPRGLQERVLEGRPRVRPDAGWLVLAAAAAGVVLAFLIGRQTAPEPAPLVVKTDTEPASVVPPEPRPPELQPGEPVRDGCPSALAVDEATVMPLGCSVSLDSPGMTVAGHTRARLVRTPRGVRVLEGDAFFAVDEVEPGRPTVQVEVDSGTIEVLGTRFVVHQADAQGHVDLLEGSIRFTAVDGQVRAVVPGHRLAWADGSITDDGALAAADPKVEHTGRPKMPTGARDDATDPSSGLDAVLDEVAMLRRRGEYRDAATLLRNARASIRDASASEILSYEEGTLRELYQAQSAACAFWRGHAARFGADGRYASAVTGRMARLGCTKP